jgi:hypothetical protein
MYPPGRTSNIRHKGDNVTQEGYYYSQRDIF